MTTLTMPKSKLIKGVEMIVDDNGIEIIVGYEYEKTRDEEEGTLVYTELESVEVVIAGRGIDILSQMHPNQKESIISKLQYE